VNLTKDSIDLGIVITDPAQALAARPRPRSAPAAPLRANNDGSVSAWPPPNPLAVRPKVKASLFYDWQHIPHCPHATTTTS
jgi:hypothetical protein